MSTKIYYRGWIHNQYEEYVLRYQSESTVVWRKESIHFHYVCLWFGKYSIIYSSKKDFWWRRIELVLFFERMWRNIDYKMPMDVEDCCWVYKKTVFMVLFHDSIDWINTQCVLDTLNDWLTVINRVDLVWINISFPFATIKMLLQLKDGVWWIWIHNTVFCTSSPLVSYRHCSLR